MASSTPSPRLASHAGPTRARIGEDLHVHPVPLVLPRVVGPVRGDPVDRQQGPVQQHERLRRRRPDCLRKSRRESGQDLDGLGDVPVRGRGPDAEPGRELGIRVAVAEVGEGEQGLTAGTQAPPSGTELLAAPAEFGGQEAQGRTGHVDARRVDKHTKPLVEPDFLVENPSTRGFTCLSPQLPLQPDRLERAQYLDVDVPHLADLQQPFELAPQDHLAPSRPSQRSLTMHNSFTTAPLRMNGRMPEHRRMLHLFQQAGR